MTKYKNHGLTKIALQWPSRTWPQSSQIVTNLSLDYVRQANWIDILLGLWLDSSSMSHYTKRNHRELSTIILIGQLACTFDQWEQLTTLKWISVFIFVVRWALAYARVNHWLPTTQRQRRNSSIRYSQHPSAGNIYFRPTTYTSQPTIKSKSFLNLLIYQIPHDANSIMNLEISIKLAISNNKEKGWSQGEVFQHSRPPFFRILTTDYRHPNWNSHTSGNFANTQLQCKLHESSQTKTH